VLAAYICTYPSPASFPLHPSVLPALQQLLNLVKAPKWPGLPRVQSDLQRGISGRGLVVGSGMPQISLAPKLARITCVGVEWQREEGRGTQRQDQ